MIISYRYSGIQLSIVRLLFFSALISLSSACAYSPALPLFQINTSDLLAGEFFFPGESIPELSDPHLLTLTDEMRAFVRHHTATAITEKQKTRAILNAILKEGSINLQYNLVKTYSARDAYEAREGNCLSFTNLFVALAREVGLNVYYQRVDIPPTWDEVGNSYIYNLHINAVVDMAPLGRSAVDFDVASFSKKYHMWEVSDQHAEAQFHNNMGVHFLRKEKFPMAFLHFKRAIEIDPDIGYFWTNLGTLYRRAGHEIYAEQALLRAIEVASDPAAMSNLAQLYSRQENTEKARYYSDQVIIYHSKNPYYQYRLAEKAYAVREFEKVKKILAEAIRLRSDDHRFYRLLALTQLQTGDLKSARKNFKQAADRATATADREKYSHKYETLTHIR